MPIYMNYSALQFNSLSANDILLGDGSVRVGHDLPDISAAIRMIHPGGVNMIVIGPSKQAGWKLVQNFGPTGSLAVLIGLLLPAVQKVREAANQAALIGLLRSSLAPGGRIFIVNGDGKLAPAV